MPKMLFFCVLLCCCAACGASSQSAQSFLLSTANSVAFVSWTASNGSLTGQYAVATKDGAQDNLALSGQQNTSQISLAGQGVILIGSVNGNTMQTSDTTTGSVLTWYAGSAQEYTRLKAVYQAYLKVQADLDTLKQVETALPSDSDPAYVHQALSGAKDRVSNEQKALQYINAQTDPFIRCSAVSEFALNFPAVGQDPELHVPFASTSQSHIVQVLTPLKADFQKASVLPFPTISGLRYAWKVNPTDQIRQGDRQVAAVQQALAEVSPQFRVLQHQASVVQGQVATVKRQHNC